MKKRRVVMAIEIETDVPTGELRTAAFWQTILDGADVPVTVVQASPLVIKERATPDGKRAT